MNSSYPHGNMSALATSLGVLAYIFTLIATLGCHFVKIDTTANVSELSGLRTDASVGVGLFSYDRTYSFSVTTCDDYTSDQIDSFDGPFRAARFFGYLSNTFNGVATLMLVVMSCVNFGKIVVKAVGVLLLLGSLFTMLTFNLFASEVCDLNCEFGRGAGYAIGSSLTALLTAVIVFYVPSIEKALELPETPPVAGLVHPTSAPSTANSVSESFLSEGVKKVTKTTIHPDGSTTVEESVVRIEDA